MPEIKIKHVVSFSSEDKVHKAENLIQPETYRQWKCATPGEKSATVVLQFEKATQINSVDIGNAGSAFVEILVGRSSDTVSDYKVLLVASSFMSPIESRCGTHSNRVRMFGPEKLSQSTKDEKWDCVQVVCTQPFNQRTTYGLSFVKFHSPPEKVEENSKSSESERTVTRMGAFKIKYLDEDENDSVLPAGSWFEKKKTEVSQSPSSSTVNKTEPSYASVILSSSSDENRMFPNVANTSNTQKRKTLEANNSSDEPPVKKTSTTTLNKDHIIYKDVLRGDPESKKVLEKSDDLKKNVESKKMLFNVSSSKKDTPTTKSPENKKTPQTPVLNNPSASNKAAKAEEKVPFRKIMDKVVLVMSGFVNPLRSTIRDKALEMGAKYKGDWDRSCTHLICAFINTPKYQQVKQMNGKIVTKEWILDCHKMKKLLPWTSYLLDSPSKDSSSSGSEESKYSEEEIDDSDDDPGYSEEEEYTDKKKKKRRTRKDAKKAKDKQTTPKKKKQTNAANNKNALSASSEEDQPSTPSKNALSVSSSQNHSVFSAKRDSPSTSNQKNFSDNSQSPTLLPAKDGSETEDEEALRDYVADTDPDVDSGGDTEDEIRKISQPPMVLKAEPNDIELVPWSSSESLVKIKDEKANEKKLSLPYNTWTPEVASFLSTEIKQEPVDIHIDELSRAEIKQEPVVIQIDELPIAEIKQEPVHIHIDAVSSVSIEEIKQEPVDIKIDEELSNLVESNHPALISIIETVIFCGRQEMPLRGKKYYDYDLSDDEDIEEPADSNNSNFCSLLQLKAKRGDKELQKYLATVSKNPSYVSSRAQNDIVTACNTIILREIVEKVNRADGFCVLCDESIEIEGLYQLPFCIRFLSSSDGETYVHEDFLQFVPFDSFTGSDLAATVLHSLSSFGLDVSKLRGQGYFREIARSGIQAHIKQKFPHALYVHCSAHSLNLAISDACSVYSVPCAMITLEKCVDFFHSSSKCQEILNKFIESLLPSVSHNRLKKICSAKWARRHDSVMIFTELLPAFIDALDEISTDTTFNSYSDTSFKASMLVDSICEVKFLVAIYSVQRVFVITLSLSKYLQMENMALAEAVSYAQHCENIIRAMRNQAEEEFRDIFSTVVKICQEQGIEMKIPHFCSHRINQSNVLQDTPENYFRTALFIPLLDSFSQQIHECFLQHKDILTSFKCLLPGKKNLKMTDERQKEAKTLHSEYSDILNCNAEVLIGELRLWYCHLGSLSFYPCNAVDALNECKPQLFPTINLLLGILSILPVSPVPRNRSYSSLEQLRTYLKNTDSEQHLNGLALLNLHREINVTPESVVEELRKHLIT